MFEEEQWTNLSKFGQSKSGGLIDLTTLLRSENPSDVNDASQTQFLLPSTSSKHDVSQPSGSQAEKGKDVTVSQKQHNEVHELRQASWARVEELERQVDVLRDAVGRLQGESRRPQHSITSAVSANGGLHERNLPSTSRAGALSTVSATVCQTRAEGAGSFTVNDVTMRPAQTQVNSCSNHVIPQNSVLPVENASMMSSTFRTRLDSSMNKYDYRLRNETKFELFLDLFTSELRSKELLYVIDPIAKSSATYDVNTLEVHKHEVRNILINRIDPTYHYRITSLKDPVQIIEKIKLIKKNEAKLSSNLIRKQIQEIVYKPGKDSIIEFEERFDELLRSYENSSAPEPLSDVEKRDGWLNAVVLSVPEVHGYMEQIESSGRTVDFDMLKTFVVKTECRKEAARKTQGAHVFQASANDVTRSLRCYTCHDKGHIGANCPNRLPNCDVKSNPKKCYFCGEFVTDHVSKTCPARSQRRDDGSSGGGSGQRYANNNKKKNYKRKNNSSDNNKGAKKAKRNDDKKPNDNKNNSGGGSNKNDNNKGTTSHNEVFTTALLLRSNESSPKTVLRSGRDLITFIADSGATEHLTNSKLIFKTFDENRDKLIRCANSDDSADLRAEGMGTVCGMNNNKLVTMHDVICADALSENLLSLRKFVDAGMRIYLDSECINIYDPESERILLSGIYDKPFWKIELQVDKEGKQSSHDVLCEALMAIDENTHKYMTRSKGIITDLQNNYENKDSCEMGISNGAETRTQVDVCSTEGVNDERNPLSTEVSNFDVTINDRALNNDENLPAEEIPEFDRTVNEVCGKSRVESKAMMWHVRLGHASLDYLKQFQRRFPDVKDLKDVKFDEEIQKCEVCLLSKFNRLPFSSVRTRADEPLLIIHSDVMGPISPSTYPHRYKYMSVFVDDSTRLAIVSSDLYEVREICWDEMQKCATSDLIKELSTQEDALSKC